MAMICFPTRLSPFSSSSSSSSTLFPSHSHPSRRAGVALVVFSSHSNPRILKSSRRSRTDRRTPSYDDEERVNEDSEEEEPSPDNDDLSDVGDQFNLQLTKQSEKTGRLKVLRKRQENGSLKIGQSLRNSYGSVKDDVKPILKKTNMTINHPILNRSSKELVDLEKYVKKKNDSFSENRYHKLAEDFGFDEKWFPLIEYLNTFGLKESDFICIYERHMPCLQINLSSAQERLEFLMSVGVKHRDIRRILIRQPQILEYTVENNLKSHVAFLVNIGVPHSRVGQIITSAPSLFSYSVEHSLKPTVRYLVEEVGIKTTDISKVVQLSPQILVQRIDSTWTLRFNFLSKELGAPKDSIVKMVTKHPQLLHYSIEDGILPRINFLRSIGMCNSDILKVLTSLAQVLSLSLEGNLKPKYLYLVNELRNEVKSLTKYPMYLSLSLDQRIRPRHRFLVFLKKAPKGPFPLSSLVPTDECFCQQWAGTSLERYLAFRQGLQMTNFAKKYERKGL
ncbi:transcription termination factor MTERF9, chloroplastic-like [Zingiber officinale]|uniref:transcription termination factor MTERF9, chloroplastic-like n=1 Tax=Zingiber officinale TaxID=94328 RepID=UPI001C4DC52A|nr:transcription termination factor MTERF9, chloroplastic-like [Zingiber officinale]XP_042442561.1 transcription termination factor MTERF9, chloroplastic-like [Zingiber officinale]